MGSPSEGMQAYIRRKFIEENPFDGQTMTVRENRKRTCFVSRGEAKAVPDACTDARWCLVFALCRLGGLRCPSEVLRLKWEEANWAKMRFIVHAHKTEHYANGGVRVVNGVEPVTSPRSLSAMQKGRCSDQTKRTRRGAAQFPAKRRSWTLIWPV